jgi:DNA polymerase III alpha subunit
MYEAHDAMICIAEGAYVDQSEPRRRLTPQHFFKSPEEMAALFADLPEALENTVEIARRCAFARGPTIRSCRNSPRTRWRSCAASRARGWPRVWR